MENKKAMDNTDPFVPIANSTEGTENDTIMDDNITLESLLGIPDNATVEEEDGGMTPPRDGNETPTMTEETLGLCPLCQSGIKLFFINFNEKMLMCENTECEFPFGYEDLQFYKEDNEAEVDDEVASIRSKRTLDDRSSSATCSVVSTAAWTDIEKLNRAYETDDGQFESNTYQKKPKKVEAEKDKEKAILKNVEDIKELNKELVTIDNKQKDQRIQNQKWIKNLMNKQTTSGISLLKPEEMMALKEQETAFGELKIDIDTSDANGISHVNVQIISHDAK
ncbi:uncharacterized protein LOC131850959 isoform X2 [Achroia grisella]|uniref:uncharacterized protein LOC131850959 isoform X2 n=1 Tax=Achroia grisella TaxID=688607 RepID=UPI0027D2F3DF|nr:uncharacterized protein LOC131850959 isoform X2 [Achroia grisella]